MQLGPCRHMVQKLFHKVNVCVSHTRRTDADVSKVKLSVACRRFCSQGMKLRCWGPGALLLSQMYMCCQTLPLSATARHRLQTSGTTIRRLCEQETRC